MDLSSERCFDRTRSRRCNSRRKKVMHKLTLTLIRFKVIRENIILLIYKTIFFNDIPSKNDGRIKATAKSQLTRYTDK